MPTEFVFMMTRATYPQSQQLPNVFLEYCFNGNRHVYLTSNTRDHFKAMLVCPNGGNIRITGQRWTELCVETLSTTKMEHFIEHDDDTFYVTGYDENGYECGGYNVVRTRPSRIVTWVWPYADYPQIFIIAMV
ncbi:hypothetical protein Tco_0432581 [Tanacetum coccineum]